MVLHFESEMLVSTDFIITQSVSTVPGDTLWSGYLSNCWVRAPSSLRLFIRSLGRFQVPWSPSRD